MQENFSKTYEVETDTFVLVDNNLKEIYDEVYSRYYRDFGKPNWLEASTKVKEELKQAYFVMMATKRLRLVD